MKKLLSLVLILMLLFSAVPMTAFAAEGDLAPTGASYDLWLGTTQVTDANKDDILNDGGKAKFDPSTNTLTLDDPYINSFYVNRYKANNLIYADGIDLKVVGNYTVSAEQAVPHYCIDVIDGDLTLDGDFILQGTSAAVAAFYRNISHGGNITIAGGSLENSYLMNSNGLLSNCIHADKDIIISSEAEYVIVYGYSAIYSAEGMITVQSLLRMVSPEGAVIIGGGIFEADGKTKAKRVEIINPNFKKYDLWVGATQVTGKNKDDILNDGGKATFDPETNTLNLYSPTIPGAYKDDDYTCKIFCEDMDLTIKGIYRMTKAETYSAFSCEGGSLTLDGSFTLFAGEGSVVYADKSLTVDGNSLTAKSSQGRGIKSYGDITVNSVRTLTVESYRTAIYAEGGITFDGAGTVSVKSSKESGVYADDDITIGSVMKLTAEGTDYGIISDSSITISSGTVIATGNDGDGIYAGGDITIGSGVTAVEAKGSECAIVVFDNIVLGRSLAILVPTGGINQNGYIYEPDGSTIASYVVIKPMKNCTVSFNANSGYGTMRSVSVSYGAVYTLPNCTFTNTGYVFSGWKVNGTLYQPGDKITVTGDVTAFAQWKSNKATVSFDANGGTRTMASSTVTNGDSFMLPGCSFLPPSGYQFQSWRVGDLYYQPGDYITVNGDTVVYAQWCNPTMIESVNVTITAPEAGKRVSFQVKKDNSSCMFNTDITNGTGLEFRDQTANDWMSAGEVFVKDRVYTANVYLITPSTGKFDSNVKVTINGHNASVMMLTNSMIIASYDFTASDTPEEGEKILLGDADTDGSVTIFDATAIQRHLAELPVESFSEKAADADEDKSVTIFDATAIQRYLAELPSNPNIGKPV